MRTRLNYHDYQQYQDPSFLRHLKGLALKDPERYKKAKSKYDKDMKSGGYQEWLKNKGRPTGEALAPVSSWSDEGPYAPDRTVVKSAGGRPISVHSMLSRGR